MSTDIKSLGSLVWSIAELLRGDFKQSEYGKVILQFAVLRHLDHTLVSIGHLKEYRSALITPAVTGQIDMQTYAKSSNHDRRLDAIQEEMGA